MGTPNYQALRVALRAVLYSKWKADDELEPGAYHLRQFVAFSRNEGRSGHARGESSEMRIRRTRWMCLFYVMDAQGESIKCRCSSTRSIQALEHVRRHIKLEPFVCRREPCPENPDGCGARYSSMDPLRKHKRGRAKCRVCLREVLPGNMKRHLEVNCHEDDSS
ncbi:hypothetical protein FS842_009635 [Serendipita sp. 407]|nr:hypothetical protein FS842_009635 [Serendipita sp. 407]